MSKINKACGVKKGNDFSSSIRNNDDNTPKSASQIKKRKQLLALLFVTIGGILLFVFTDPANLIGFEPINPIQSGGYILAGMFLGIGAFLVFVFVKIMMKQRKK